MNNHNTLLDLASKHWYYFSRGARGLGRVITDKATDDLTRLVVSMSDQDEGFNEHYSNVLKIAIGKIVSEAVDEYEKELKRSVHDEAMSIAGRYK